MSENTVTSFGVADKRKMLRGLDQLRDGLASGEIASILFIGIRSDDTTVMGWGSHGEGLSILRGLGAIEALKHRFLQDLPPLPKDAG